MLLRDGSRRILEDWHEAVFKSDRIENSAGMVIEC